MKNHYTRIALQATKGKNLTLRKTWASNSRRCLSNKFDMSLQVQLLLTQILLTRIRRLPTNPDPISQKIAIHKYLTVTFLDR